MRLRPLISLSALLVALLAPCPPARGADELAWGLAPGEIVRYDLTPDPGSGGSPAPDVVRLVRADDFERGRRPRADVGSIAELVWRHALAIPDVAGAAAAKRGASAAVDERHAACSLAVSGTDEVSSKDGLVRLKATLSIAADPAPAQNASGYVAGTTLVVVRTFDPVKRRLVEATYALDMKLFAQGKTTASQISGRIACAGPVDLGARAFLASVESSIARGRKNLKGELERHIAAARKAAPGAQGAYAMGYAAIAVFALLRSGEPPDELADAFAFLESCPWTEVYSVSIYLMCLEARSVRRVAIAPEAGGHTVTRYEREPVPDGDKALMSKAAEWLLAARVKGAWTYHPMKGAAVGGDRSNSQFAVLALHVAITCGVKVDPQAMADVAEEVIGAQEPSGPLRTLRGCTFTAAAPRGIGPGGAGGGAGGSAGGTVSRDRDAPLEAKERGFGYGMTTRCTPGTAYGSMTAAGVSSAVIAREALRRAGRLDAERDEKTRRAIHDGIAWLAARFTPGQNPEKPGAECFYWLYSLEKAMELSGVESLAGHVWWLEGAAHLVAIQDRSGRDRGSWGGMSDTSLALLFLNRATLPTRIAVEARPTVSSGKEDPSSWDLVKVEGTGFVHVAQVLEALLAASPEDAKDVIRIAEKAFDELPPEVSPRLVPRLVRLALGEGPAPARAFARKALRAASGGIEDEGKALSFHRRWESAVRAGEKADYAAIPELAGILRDRDATAPLRRAALVSLARLRAVEALPALLDELGSSDAAWRREVFTVVVSIAGGERRPFDPDEASAPERARRLEAWRAWWRDEGPALVAAEATRRRP